MIASNRAASPFRSRAFVVGLAITFLSFFSLATLFPIIPRLVTKGLDGDEADVGRILATFAIAAIGCRPLLSLVLRRGVRTLAIVGSLLTLLGAIGFFHARSLPALAVCQVLLAFGEVFVWTSVATFSTSSVPAERQAEAIALGSVPIFMAYAIGPIATDKLALQGRFSVALLVPLTAAILSFVLCLLVRDNWSVSTAKRGRLTMREVFHPNALAPGIAYFFASAGWSAWSAYIALRADGLGMNGIGGLLIVYSVTCLFIRFSFAKAPEQVGLKQSAAATTLSIASGLAVIGFSEGPLGLYIGAALIASGIALIFPTMSAISLRGMNDPSERGSLLSSISMFYDIGVGFGGLVLGPFARDLGINVAFRIAAGVTLLAVPLIVRLQVTAPVPHAATRQ